MASKFDYRVARNVSGANAAQIQIKPEGGNAPTPDAGKVWTVFGVILCNKAGVDVPVDLFTRDPGGDTYHLFAFTIPTGESHYSFGAQAKKVLKNAGSMFIRSPNGAVDASMEFVEQDQA